MVSEPCIFPLGLSASSKQLIEQEVAANPKLTYRMLVSGKGLKDRLASSGSLVREDPAFANADLVNGAIARARARVGKHAVEAGLVNTVIAVIEALGEEMYIRTPPSLARGPTPMIICANDMQLYFFCSLEMFTIQQVDATYAEL